MGSRPKYREEYHEKNNYHPVVKEATYRYYCKRYMPIFAQNELTFWISPQTIVQGYFNMMMVADTSASDKKVQLFPKNWLLSGMRSA